MHGFPIRRASGAAFALALALAIGACSRTDSKPTPDSATAAAPGAARGLATGPRGPRAYPGALTKPIDSYSGDELYELTRSLPYAGSHERQRKCKNATNCGPSSAKRTLVQVSAVAGQDSISAANAPEFGAVYVRAINRGDAEEARYGMRPGKTLRYYVIVQRDSAGGLGWRLEELDTAVPRRHARIASGRITSCGHAWRAGARADFRSCAQAEPSDTVVTLAQSLRATDDPLWTECDMGCCIMQ